MDTTGLMRYVLAEDKHPAGREDERSYRKNDVSRALSKVVKDKLKANTFFMVTLTDFVQQEAKKGNLVLDFDINLLSRSTQLLSGLFSAAWEYLAKFGQVLEWNFPEEDKNLELVIHDSTFGDGGVARIHSIRDHPNLQNAYPDSVIKELEESNIFPQFLMPIGGDPSASNLPANYWKSVRELVKRRLSE